MSDLRTYTHPFAKQINKPEFGCKDESVWKMTTPKSGRQHDYC